MTFLYGKIVAERLYEETKERIMQSGITPGLGVILAGNDPASHLYVGLKEKAAKRVGIDFEKKLFSEDVSPAEIIAAIEEFNKREDIHGILVQLPLPSGLPTDEIISSLDPKKDTDGFHKKTIAEFLAGDKEKCPVFPRAIVELLRETKHVFENEKGIVIANSLLMGNVMAEVLTLEGMESEFIRSSEPKSLMVEKLKEAKVLITACGIPRFITGDMLPEGIIVIDGGIEHEGEKVVGDVEEESVSSKASFLSPVPGGVGPVTVATLLARVTDAALESIDK